MINFINISDAKAVICDEKYLKSILDNREKLKNNVLFINIDSSSNIEDSLKFNKLLDDGAKKITTGNTAFKDIKINPDDMHVLLFTSGTTGNAKGICLSHKNICSNIMSVAQIVKVDKSTVVLSILPIHHTYECTLGHLLPLYGGGTVTYCDGLRYINKNINEYKPSFVICVPLLLENIHKKIVKTLQKTLPAKYFNNGKHFLDNMPPVLRFFVRNKIKKSLGGNLRTFIVGAAAIDPNIIESFYKIGFKALQGYGLTECSPLVAGNNDFFYKADSVGLPIPNVEYKINNPDDQGVGEIIVKGPNVMLGYYNNESATAQAFKEGWFCTGDLGRFGKDGSLFITGRKKDLIVLSNGKKVFPEEIEALINKIDIVEESMVYEDNDKICAEIVYSKDNMEKNNLATVDDVRSVIEEEIKIINKNLPIYKYIREFSLTDVPLIKTTTQKIKRHEEMKKIKGE